jgi:uncharacterized protein (TIGR03083 family)
MSDVDLGASYRTVRERLTDLVGALSEAELETSVPGCPLWRVRDVLAHLTGATADFVARDFEGAPGPAWTARHVDARRDKSVAEILDEWGRIAPVAEAELTELGHLPQSVVDVVTHEQDIRGAAGQPGFRDDDIAVWAAGFSVSNLGKKLTGAGLPALRVRSDSGERVLGEGEPGVTLDATDFEVIRAVFGRRSRAQLEAMAWDGDPQPYLEHLNIFPPSELDVVE